MWLISSQIFFSRSKCKPVPSPTFTIGAIQEPMRSPARLRLSALFRVIPVYNNQRTWSEKNLTQNTAFISHEKECILNKSTCYELCPPTCIQIFKFQPTRFHFEPPQSAAHSARANYIPARIQRHVHLSSKLLCQERCHNGSCQAHSSRFLPGPTATDVWGCKQAPQAGRYSDSIYTSHFMPR